MNVIHIVNIRIDIIELLTSASYSYEDATRLLYSRSPDSTPNPLTP